MKKAYLYIAISTLMFSSMEIALKMAGGAFNPIQLNLIRFFIGAVVLLPFALNALKQTGRKLVGADIRLFALTGLICVIVSMSLYQLAITVDQASTVAVLFSCNPVFALIFSYLILHERLGRANLISVIISVIGLLIIVNPAHLTNGLGLVLAISSAVTFGLYSIVSRYGSVKRGLNGLTMTCFTFFAGAFELLVLAWVTKIQAVAHGLAAVGLRQFAAIPILVNVNLNYFWLLFFIGVCVTGGGFAFYFLAMEKTDVSTASLVFFIKPALAPILAAAILHEQIVLTTIIGIVVILIGSVVTFVGNRFKERDSAMGKAEASAADAQAAATKLAQHSNAISNQED
ncbi:DMT family transporter [Lactiplantibacillus carotarum]|uniref:DMT family transporter n=1 Tax=Lactiplantibacillus carotarum TaxID=2993456 RepID=UPI00298F37C9|nr:DMT family transporter [Lactiplantibacillus carotarum]